MAIERGKPQNYREHLQPCPLVLYISISEPAMSEQQLIGTICTWLYGCLAQTQNFVVRRALAGHVFDIGVSDAEREKPDANGTSTVSHRG